MKRMALLMVCLLIIIAISGCATDQGGGSTYDYESSSGSHAGHHH